MAQTRIVEKFRANLTKTLAKTAQRAKEIMQEEASKSVAKKPYLTERTGALERSIFAEKRGKNEYAVGTRIPYAKYVIYGRGAIDMRAKGKPYPMRWQAHGKKIVAQRVSPQDPHNFIKDTANRLRGENYGE